MSEEEKLLKEARKLPWEDRLSHKNWKVRNDANIDLAALCDSIPDPKDPRLREFGPLFRKTVADANAPVQEKALDALIAFLRAADADAGRYAKEVCDAIVAKCLTGRPKTVEKSQVVFLLWVELEAAEVFLDAMEKAIKNKVAKAVVPAIDVMFQALSEFGAKVVPPKRILKMLPELFDHQDQHVRASSKGLTLELCRWIGKDAVKSILFEKMRDTMRKELEAELPNVSGTAKPMRKIRSEQDNEPEQDEVASASGPHQSEDSVVDGPQEIDEYDLVDPVDVLAPLEKSGFWEGVKAAKWSERRDAVAELTKLASTKKISPGDFAEVSRTLKKLITDVNIAVATEAIQAIGNLAKGLRNHFAGNSRLVLPVLLEKLKEKKPVLTEALTQTLQAMHKSGCLTLADVLEDVKVAVKNKVPLVRSLSLNWVTFCIETSNRQTVLKVQKDYVLICMECLNDGTPEVRDASFAALAAIAKSVGMKPLERSLEKLDEVRKKKLSEMIGNISDGNLAVSGTASTSSVSLVRSSVSEGTQNSYVKRSAASMLSGKKVVQPMATVKKAGTVKTGASKKDVSVQYRSPVHVEVEDVEPAEMSLEEIEGRLTSVLKSETISQLKSNVWKERLEAMVLLKQEIEGISDLDRMAELLVRLLCAVPGWGEKNVQVQQQVIEVITHIASTVSKFSKRSVVLCIFGISERVADIKTRAHAMKCLTAFSEAVGPGFVFERLYKIMKEHKNPKVLSEGISWMVTAIEDFGVSHLKLKDLIDFCKDTGLQSSAAATRNATIKLIGMLHKFVGPDIKGFLSDVKPALLSVLDAEYEKNPFEVAAVVPKKTVKSSDQSSETSTSGFDGLPREDISSKITPNLLKNLGSPDWKVRLESIETVNKIVEEANKRIQSTGTGELFGALRGRLYDTNKNLVIATLSAIGNIASAMGPEVEKSSKKLLADVLKCLADNKKLMRECTLKTLDCWVVAVHFDKMVPYISAALVDFKLGAEGRKDLFDWLSKQLPGINDSTEILQLLKPTASALTDKSAEVRKSAESSLGEIIRICGNEVVSKGVKDLHGPALALVLERTKPSIALQEAFDSSKVVSSGTTARAWSKVGKAAISGPSKHGSRTINLKGTQTKLSRPDAAEIAQDLAVQGQALFNTKDSNKEERERIILRRYKFEELRLEQIQELEVEMMKYFRDDLHRRLLSTDFKKQVDGLEMLQRALPAIGKEILEMVDILLKWIVLRFCESNTTCLLKVLEFLPEFIDALNTDGYTLTEAEASIFLPCLIEKSGHNIEKMREKLRDLMKQISCIYPAPKLFPYVLEGLRSKNNRTRIECVDLIGYMIESHGPEISGQFKSLQLVASLTSERDGEIRKGALNTMATAYKILGIPFLLEVAEQSGEVLSRSSTTPVLTSARTVNGHFEFHTDRHALPRSLAAANSPSDWNEALENITLGSPEQSVEGMKVVCHELALATSDPENSSLDDIVKDADRLVSCLAAKVPKAFDFSLAGASSRSCKYVLNTLMQTFQIKRLAYAVKESTLNSLITELLLWLLDERVPLMDDGSQLLKALNVLMLKILDNAERTSSFVVLINLLQPLDASRWPSPSSVETLPARNQKFSELVVKCLIKLTKVLPSTIYDVDLDRILQSIHVYLQELGMEEIRKRAGADDKPLRMVKTVLHELVKLRGTAIKGHLSMVPIDMEPQPIILAYIDLNLQTLAAARMLTPSGPVGQTHWGDSASNSPSTTTHSADAQLKQELAAVFKKIADKQTCTIGLFELYRITQLYPKVDIFAQLQNASEAFRTYIRDGLAQMENNAAAGRTPSSLPISTPPPVSLMHSSPKLAPLSPVHAKLQNIKTEIPNTNPQASRDAVESGRDMVGSPNKNVDHSDSREQYEVNERCIPAAVASGGGLDALKERMKSIQAAVAAGVSEGGSRSQMPPNGSITNSIQDSQLGYGLDSQSSDTSIQCTVLPMDEKALSGLQARMERLKSGSADIL
ncbi:unnamed protein product [Victoria cruziana]